jgi:hypothetical protein
MRLVRFFGLAKFLFFLINKTEINSLLIFIEYLRNLSKVVVYQVGVFQKVHHYKEI